MDPRDPAMTKLVGAIYDCTLDPTRWDETLPNIASLLGAESAILSLNNLDNDTALIKKTVGWEERWLREREKHLPKIHQLLGAWLLGRPHLDDLFIGSREVPAQTHQASRYLNDCLRPQGIDDVAHLVLAATESYFSEIVLFWRAAHGDMTDSEVALGLFLLPHLRRAITISNAFGAQTLEKARMSAALDALRQGVILTDARGAILYANRSAEQMLVAGDPLAAVGNRISAKRLASNAELLNALIMAGRNGMDIGQAGAAVRLSELEAPAIFAHVLPMQGGELRPEMEPGAVAAIVIDSSPEKEAGAYGLAAAFRLTGAEKRILARLLAGRTLTAAAHDLGIARTTARTHLSSIFNKTGVSRQTELVRLAMQTSRHTR